MNTYAEAKVVAESEGTEKSLKFRKAARKFIFWGTIVVLLIVATLSVAIYPKRDKEQKPREKQVLSMPANGDSPHVNTRPGYAIDYTGSGFSIHCVYRDGSEGVVGDQKNPCKDGPMLYQYVRDTTGKANVATYAFVRPN